MRTSNMVLIFAAYGWLPILAGAALAPAAEPSKLVESGTLVVIDGTGKEQKLKNWKFVLGTHRLSWLEPAAPARDKEKEGEKAKVPAGPEALQFREENSTDFENGILTLVPLERIRSIDYENDTDSVTVHVATSDKSEGDVVLTGTTRFVGVNKLTIEAEVDLGDLGVAEKKFLGGIRKGIRAVRFPVPKAAPAQAPGRPASVTATDKDKSAHKVTDLQPLYRLADGSERRLATLQFKKTLKVDLGKIQSLQLSKGTGKELDCQLSLKSGDEHTLTLLRTISHEGQMAALEGFLARVPAGYKLFPLHTIAEIQFDAAKLDTKDK